FARPAAVAQARQAARAEGEGALVVGAELETLVGELHRAALGGLRFCGLLEADVNAREQRGGGGVLRAEFARGFGPARRFGQPPDGAAVPRILVVRVEGVLLQLQRQSERRLGVVVPLVE